MEAILHSPREMDGTGEAREGGTAHRHPLGMYFAVLYIPGRVERVPKGMGRKGPPGGFHLRLEGGSLPLPKAYRGKPMAAYLGSFLRVRFWPRTLADGTLDPRSPLAGFFPKPKLGQGSPLALRGRLVGVDREEGTFQVEIRPNPGGRLEEPFRLTLWASLALLEGLPPLGQGVYVKGQYRPGSRRLVALLAWPQTLWDDP